MQDLSNVELIRGIEEGDYYSLETAELIRRFKQALLKDAGQDYVTEPFALIVECAFPTVTQVGS